jgi:hypothetical protein
LRQLAQQKLPRMEQHDVRSRRRCHCSRVFGNRHVSIISGA